MKPFTMHLCGIGPNVCCVIIQFSLHHAINNEIYWRKVEEKTTLISYT